MANQTMHLETTFLPVGHGLFSICDFGNERGQFKIVYDCGNMYSSEEYLTEQIYTQPRENIDLLVISHFHKDHISGIPELLRWSRGISRAWIPHFSPKMRLIYAVSLAAWLKTNAFPPTGYLDVLDFLVRPEQWLLERGMEVSTFGGPIKKKNDTNIKHPENYEHKNMQFIRANSWKKAFSKPKTKFKAYYAMSDSLVPRQKGLLELITWTKKLDKDLLEKQEEACRKTLGDGITYDIATRAKKKAEKLSYKDVMEIVAAIPNGISARAIREFYEEIENYYNAHSLSLMVRFIGEYKEITRRLFTNGIGQQSLYQPETRHTKHQPRKCPAILWSGDTPKKELGELVRDVGDPLRRRLGDVSVWQVPHHGSIESYQPEFYDILGDYIGFVCSREGDRAHPAPFVAVKTNAIIITEKCRLVTTGIYWR